MRKLLAISFFLFNFATHKANGKLMKQAMIFAAGLGTRLKPLTDTMPKALVKVSDRPLLDLTIQRLQEQGYQRFVVNVHHFAQQVIDHVMEKYPQDLSVNPLSPRIFISDERDALLETGGGLKKAAPFFHENENILIHNVDILDNVDYEWFSRQHLAEEDAVLLVSRRKTKRYLIFDNGMRLMGWVNVDTREIRSPFEWMKHPDAAELDLDNFLIRIRRDMTELTYHLFAFSGIHSFSPRLFKLMEQFPDRFAIMDFYLQTCHRTRIYGCLKDDLKVLDVGKLDTLEQAEKFLSLTI